MPFTLAQAKELSQDKLTNDVIDEFRKSPLLDVMVWDDIMKPQGGESFTYTYNRVTTLPTAAGRAINSEYTPQEAATKQVTVTAKIFGGSFQIDRALKKHERQVLDLVDFQLKQKSQATAALFNDWFINGDSGVDAASFDGINKAVKGSSTERSPTDPIDISSAAAIKANWELFLYEVRQTIALMDGAPSIMAVNRPLFAAFQSIADFSTQFQQTKSELGTEIVKYGNTTIMEMGDKPGTTNPIIPITGGLTSLYMMRLGLDGVHAITPDGVTAPEIYLPDMTEPGAVKTGEVEMVAAAVLKSTKSAAALAKIKVA